MIDVGSVSYGREMLVDFQCSLEGGQKCMGDNAYVISARLVQQVDIR